MSRLKIDPSIFTIPNNIAVTGRIKSWLTDLQESVNSQDTNWFTKFINKHFGYKIKELRRLPVSCTVYVVGDSMDEIENSIEHSWLYTSQGLRNGAGVAIHLSKLRPKNTPNGKGLVSSGPVSFAQIYSKLNEILRRGGTFRNGAVTLHLDYDHPDIVEFATAPRDLLPWARRAINVDENFINHPDLDVLLKSVETGDCFLVKKQYDSNGNRLYHNVCLEVLLPHTGTCVSADTWITTDKGSQQVKDLIGKPFLAKVNGNLYSSTEQGFWETGVKDVYSIETKNGYAIKATKDHKLLRAVRLNNDKQRREFKYEWIEVQNLQIGDELALNNHSHCPAWEGDGTFEQGWLVGSLLADGHYEGKQAALQYWGDNKEVMTSQAIKYLNNESNSLQSRRSHYKGCLVVNKYDDGVNSESLRVCSTALGEFTLNKLGMKKGNKFPDEAKLATMSSEFQRGFLQGLFDGDGTLNLGGTSSSGKRLSLTTSQLDLAKIIQRMLSRFGIISNVYKTTNPQEQVINGNVSYHTGTYMISITRDNILRFESLIGFSQPEKKERLTDMLNSFQISPRRELFTSKVKSIEYVGKEVVYDCTIHDVHEFDANGIRAHNCLLSHVNLGALKLEDIVPTFIDGMNWLCRVHASTGVDLGGYYLSPKEDKQVGLGVLGLANLLAIEGITYEELVRGMEKILGLSNLPTSEKGYTLAWNLYRAYQESAKIAQKYKMDRAFVVAPTANCSFKYKDREFYVTTPEIAPPVDTSVERDSQTMGVLEVDYHPDCQIASEVGWDVYYRLNKCWQMYMDSTGLGHAISTNWWSDKVQMNKDFVADWLKSPLKSIYYAWQVSPQVQDKSEIISSDDFELEQSEECLPCMMKKQEQEQENAYNTECSACAE